MGFDSPSTGTDHKRPPDAPRSFEDRDPPVRTCLDQPVAEVRPGCTGPDDCDIELILVPRRRGMGHRADSHPERLRDELVALD